MLMLMLMLKGGRELPGGKGFRVVRHTAVISYTELTGAPQCLRLPAYIGAACSFLTFLTGGLSSPKELS